jgi:hypothetical protein
MLKDAAKRGKGQLKWFPSTIIKEVEITTTGQLIQSAIAIQHQQASSAPPLNTEPLSQTIEDSYRYENSPRFDKTILRFVSSNVNQNSHLAHGIAPTWYIVDATETGELIALTDVPYQLGIDPRFYQEPSSSSAKGDPTAPRALPTPLLLRQLRSHKSTQCRRSILNMLPTTVMNSHD